jgi:hypothetical protein
MDLSPPIIIFQVAGLISPCHHTQIGWNYLPRLALILLISTSCVAGITGVSYSVQLE